MSNPKFMVLNLKKILVTGTCSIAVIALLFFAGRHFVSLPNHLDTEPTGLYQNGTYIAPVALGDTQLNVAVTIQDNLITSVDIQNFTQQEKIMYPLLQASVNYINKHITKRQSFDIPENEEAKETTALLLNAAKYALSAPEETKPSDEKKATFMEKVTDKETAKPEQKTDEKKTTMKEDTDSKKDAPKK